MPTHYALLETRDDEKTPLVVFRIKVMEFEEVRGHLDVWPAGINWVPWQGKKTARKRRLSMYGPVPWKRVEQFLLAEERAAAERLREQRSGLRRRRRQT